MYFNALYLYIPVAISQICTVRSQEAVAKFRSSGVKEQLEITFECPLQIKVKIFNKLYYEACSFLSIYLNVSVFFLEIISKNLVVLSMDVVIILSSFGVNLQQVIVFECMSKAKKIYMNKIAIISLKAS
jgi:hypothetical protein